MNLFRKIFEKLLYHSANINPQFIIENKLVYPHSNDAIQPNGIDLTTSKAIELNHTEYTTFIANEKIKIPKEAFALVFSRSTFNRQGIIARGTVFDSGYEGRPMFSIYNLSGSHISIPKDTRMLQIIFFRADSAGLYKGQYQNENL